MEPQCRPLLAPLPEIPDPRQARGRRHPLAAILAVTWVAMLCGYRSDTAIADWGRCYGEQRARALGFTHDNTPCAATLHPVLRKRDGSLVEAALGAWAERVLTALPPAAGELEAIAIDGKTLRGRRTQGAPAVHRLSALSHRLGLTVWQQAVADKTHEIPGMEAVLRGLLLEGRVITVEAWLTHRAIAQQLVDGGGDDVRIVKGHQPQLQPDIRLVFQEPIARTEIITACETVDHGHGRLEERRLTTSPALVRYSDWPGLAQGCPVERRVTVKTSGAQRAAVVYGVTSLAPERARPEELLRLVRQHWQIENQVHWVRDVTCDEDRSQVRCGRIPQHRHRLATLGRGNEYRGGLPPLGCPAMVGFSPDRNQPRKLNGPGRIPSRVDTPPLLRYHPTRPMSAHTPLRLKDEG